MLSLKSCWHDHQQSETYQCRQHSARVSRTPPSAGWIPATQQDSVRWEEWHISSLPGSLGPKAKLHWPGVSRAALGVAQPRTGRHAYLNCRRRLKKTNGKLVPHRKGVNSPSYMVGMRTSSLVWQAFGHDTIAPGGSTSEQKRAALCVRRNRLWISIGGNAFNCKTGDLRSRLQAAAVCCAFSTGRAKPQRLKPPLPGTFAARLKSCPSHRVLRVAFPRAPRRRVLARVSSPRVFPAERKKVQGVIAISGLVRSTTSPISTAGTPAALRSRSRSAESSAATAIKSPPAVCGSKRIVFNSSGIASS